MKCMAILNVVVAVHYTIDTTSFDVPIEISVSTPEAGKLLYNSRMALSNRNRDSSVVGLLNQRGRPIRSMSGSVMAE